MTNMNTMQTPNHIISLASSAILVQVSVSTSTGSKRDGAVSDEVAADKQAQRGSVEVSKKLFNGCPQHHALTKFTATCANRMKEFTAPWGDSGLRILPHNRYEKFMAWYESAVIEHTTLKDAFLDVYDSLVNNAALGRMFNRNDFPPRLTMAGNFTISLYKQQVPMGDFRVQIAQELADDLHDYYAKQSKQYVDGIMDEMSGKFVTFMERIRNSCGYTERVNKEGQKVISRNRLVEGTVEKALEMCDMLRTFNPTGNASLEEARVALEQLLRGVDIEKLRNSDTQRARVVEEVDDILGKFKF